ncbi:hypothetical protein [Novosphingobium sp.]|uniref:hypothetical protein n=1 Tax=Novosphingobium sp. TaxID=1874826 RepID=UPI002FDD8F30
MTHPAYPAREISPSRCAPGGMAFQSVARQLTLAAHIAMVQCSMVKRHRPPLQAIDPASARMRDIRIPKSLNSQ